MDLIDSIHRAQIGREYRVVVGDNGLPALELIEGRGRPRALTGEQVIAAIALSNLKFSQRAIAGTLGVSQTAVRTAIGSARA